MGLFSSSDNPPARDPSVVEAEERFFALRNSGYTGGIDQDGHAVDVDQWIEDHR